MKRPLLLTQSLAEDELGVGKLELQDTLRSLEGLHFVPPQRVSAVAQEAMVLPVTSHVRGKSVFVRYLTVCAVEAYTYVV